MLKILQENNHYVHAKVRAERCAYPSPSACAAMRSLKHGCPKCPYSKRAGCEQETTPAPSPETATAPISETEPGSGCEQGQEPEPGSGCETETRALS